MAPFARAHGVPATNWTNSFTSLASMMEKPASGAFRSAKLPAASLSDDAKAPIPTWDAGVPAGFAPGKATELVMPEGHRP
jgi:hypothetical protein